MVAEQLELTAAWAGPALEGLCTAGLLVEDGTVTERRFWYRPATPSLESSVTVLAGIYDEHRAEVLRTLNENAVDRIRAAAARTFGAVFEREAFASRDGPVEGGQGNDEGSPVQ